MRFGASLAAFTCDRFGRKKSLLAAAALFTVSSVGAALPRNITEFVLARLVGGLAIGLASTLSPLYIAEIAPPRIRGLLVSVNQLAIVTGILLSYSVDYGLTGAARRTGGGCSVRQRCRRHFSCSRCSSFLKVHAGWCKKAARMRPSTSLLASRAIGRRKPKSLPSTRGSLKKAATSSIQLFEDRWWLPC